MVDVETWRTSSKTIEKSQRYYAHFDYRTDISKCWEYISTPDNIASHGFYPFIHYVQKMDKFSESSGIKEKSRDICYAAHIDRCIFQYYNYILNTLYNDECERLGTNKVAVAYRTNMKRQSNVDFAKEAIQFIRNHDDCFAMIGDFTKFFDNLNHDYLKKQWCRLLHTSQLPDDHYAVYKNITRFSFFELTDLLKIKHLEDNAKGRRELNSMRRILSPQELKESRSLINRGGGTGIPQGSPMSGVLANIYMLEIDKAIYDFVSMLNGFYMRYSDDFIIVLPNLGEETAMEKLKEISEVFNSPDYPGLQLQPNKTQYYCFQKETITNCGSKINPYADCSNPYLNFLGFSFDGAHVSLRAKTVSKYYQRMRRKAKTIVKSNGYTKQGNQISKENLYKKYSVRGANTRKGNFLTYANRAQNKFEDGDLISQIPERNMYKVRRFLKKDYEIKNKNKTDE